MWRVAFRYEFYHREEEKIPFDLEKFNYITKGGLPNKTLNIALAGTGVGKSLFMCHMASACLLRSKNVLTMSESSDVHMIRMYQRFVQDTDRDNKNQPKISRKMGYIATVNDAKDILEKLYKSSPHKESSS